MLTQRRETRRLGGAAGALAALERAVHEDLLETNREMREGGSGPMRNDVSRLRRGGFCFRKGRLWTDSRSRASPTRSCDGPHRHRRR